MAQSAMEFAVSGPAWESYVTAATARAEEIRSFGREITRNVLLRDFLYTFPTVPAVWLPKLIREVFANLEKIQKKD